MEKIILFAPLVGALICGFGWKLIGERTGQIIATSLVFLGALKDSCIVVKTNAANVNHSQAVLGERHVTGFGQRGE